MPDRRILSLVLLVLLCACASAQNVVSLQVMVFAEGEQHPLGDPVTVLLMDSWGSSEGQLPARDGIVEFVTVPGLHRLQVSGATIEQYDGEFVIGPNEPSHMERVVVGRRAVSSAKPIKSSIAAVRLHIPHKARKEYEEGKVMEGKDWGEARKHYETAIAIYPNYDLAYNSLGAVAQRSGDKEGARQAFSRAVSINPDFAEAYRNLARIFLSEKNYIEAEQALKKSLNTEPLDPWALTFTAYAEMRSGKFDDAIAHARKVHELPHSGLADAHLIIAQSSEILHRPQQALAEYQLYLSESPGGSNVQFARESISRLSSAQAK